MKTSPSIDARPSSISFSSRNRHQTILFETSPAAFTTGGGCAYRSRQVTYRRAGQISLRRRNRFAF
ncbi:MAG: hypothetical protein AAGF97_05990 [Planctomycetota bacterium]